MNFPYKFLRGVLLFVFYIVCFFVILRIKYNNIFKEIHIKVFNTGKLEIPGIQNDEILINALNNLIQILKPLIPNLAYNHDIDTVLINSNFTCNYFINRSIGCPLNLFQHQYGLGS